MKIPLKKISQCNEGVVASTIFIILLAIMMILVMAESRALFHLHREVKFLEQQQVKRLENLPPAPVSATNLDFK